MNEYSRGEYDNYTLPDPVITKETPETRKILDAFYEEAKAMAARHHKEADNRSEVRLYGER